MKPGVRILLFTLFALAVASAVVFVKRDDIGAVMLTRAVQSSIFNDAIADMPDGLNVAFCGTGSPFPSPERSGPCTAVIAGGRTFIVDAGRGAGDMMVRMGLQPSRQAAVLLTHFHSDHIDGLGHIAEHHWLAGTARAPLIVIGPTGVDRVVNGFNEAYALNKEYRVAHEPADIARPQGFGLVAHPFDPPTEGSIVVYDQDGLRIIAFRVNHPTVDPAVGYRFDYAGRSVVVSGDTTESANLVRASADADLLVHEVMSLRTLAVLDRAARASGRDVSARLFAGVTDLHSTPQSVMAEAAEARVHGVAFTHFIPPAPMAFPLDHLFLGEIPGAFRGALWMSRDGDLISLPARQSTFSTRRLLR